MSVFWGNIFLPLVWMALTGQFTFANYLIGFLITSLALWMVHKPGEVNLLIYLARLGRWLRFSLFFLKELTVASLRVVNDILTKGHGMRPAVIAVPLDLKSNLEITLLASLVTLTPGSLCLEVSPERDVMFIHAMYVEDVEEFRRQIKEKMEYQVREVLR
ncbi:MAG TPA: Na+/H+ antiporter subunit E [Desulfurivibrio alkaliphilus]|uniref:Na+/H+ antiporter subunit E n=1 Tax=Desulfurivibrio alkaliphilus TaxID=427923 RepID=A0A7C2XAD6_9BACT|nr:Na+/H+ antiporter subunit E [Desulfurivibrio alkaliphilus]